MTPKEILRSAHTILVVDWPSKDVPESLALAGFHIIVKGGPGPEDYSAYEVTNGRVTPRRTGRAPDHADIIYSYRPLTELPGIIAQAKSLGAKTIWTQSGRTAAGTDDPTGCWLPEEDAKTARDQVHAASLNLITQPYIVDAARELQSTRP
jgi:predicted CoA-binding protein